MSKGGAYGCNILIHIAVDWGSFDLCKESYFVKRMQDILEEERKGYAAGRRMKISGLVLLTMLLCLTASIVYAGNYEVTKKVGGYNVVMKIDRNPPVASNNNVTIEVTNASTGCACDATVSIEYSKPATPGAPALHYKAGTALKRGRHIGKISLSTVGFWNIAVKIMARDKTWTTNFVVDVE